MEKRRLPGYGLSFGISILFLSLFVFLPLAALSLRFLEISPSDVLKIVSGARVRSALLLSLGISFLAAFVNVFLGVLVAWVLTRYTFPGRALLNALVDLPFAVPTAVAGIALTTLYAPQGWFGKVFATFGVDVAFTRSGIFVALLFVGFPFVVRTVQPVLAELDTDTEAAAQTLGAGPWRCFFSVTLPSIIPSILTGFSLAMARGLGEYGSVVFISGNMPLRTEILPLLIMTKLEQFDMRGAVVLAVLMLSLSFLLLFGINKAQMLLMRRRGAR
ncbi:MAG: sulfate ABC transporter permease subunit CysT [Deltaproteobacteria bacterium]|nr:sulfate ABC transporter permease subunit CysT [Deltaproteobacteria bacterium]